MNYDLDTEEGMKNAAEWTYRTMALLAVGGVWGVPRSGCLVTKTGERSCRIQGAERDEGLIIGLVAAGFDVVSDTVVISQGNGTTLPTEGNSNE
jgi:hypothetical protein